MTVGLMGAIFYLGYFLLQTPDTSSKSLSSPVAPRKTKAQAVTSQKFIALNASNEQQASLSLTLAPTSLTPTISISPTPTEIILAVASASLSPMIGTTSGTLTPTKTKILPSAGYINNALIIFGLAGLLIFYSLIF